MELLVQTSLEQHFDAAFAAPEGMKKLRELILALSMQGKLVPQDPSDQPASELLKEIKTEKRQLIAAGKIREPKPLPPVTLEEQPYEVPQGWAWVRLGAIINFTNGYAFKSSSFQTNGVGVVKIGDIVNGMVDKRRMDFIDEEELKDLDDKFIVNPGEMLIAMSGATTGKIGINSLPDKLVMNQRVGRIEPMRVGKMYLFHYLSTQIEKNLKISSGSAIPNLSTEQINEMLFPLPPLLEQHRIVARIDQLMARCDELEALRTAQQQKRLEMHTSALNSLLTAQEPQAFAEAWRFVAEQFSDLYSVLGNVSELRKAVLQLAVMGKLVPQDASDPPASELLEEIKAEKRRLVAAGKIRESKPLPPVRPEEQPYEVPQGWAWVRLGEGTVKITDGTHHSPINSDTGDYLYISAKNIKNDGILLSNASYVTKESHTEIYSRCDPEYGDILYIKDGATTGVATINNLKSPFSMLSSVALLKLPPQLINTFLLSILRSPYFYAEMRAGMTGVAITRVTLTKLIDTPIPLPPLLEQRRIVAKIDHLMALCDTLEAQLTAQTGKQSELLRSLMDAVTPRSSTPERRTGPVRVSFARADPESSEAAELERQGRPAKARTEATVAQGEQVAMQRGRGRPPKNAAAPLVSIPRATSEADAIRLLEALKLERAQGTRQVSLFEPDA